MGSNVNLQPLPKAVRRKVELAAIPLRAILFSPGLRSEAFDGCVVARLRRTRCVLFFRIHGFDQVPRGNGTDGVKGIMAR